MSERPNNLLLKTRIHTTLIAAGISHHKFAVFAGVSPATLGRYLAGQRWSARTERKLERALARLPKRKSTKHRRINLEEEHGKA
jgi:predicted transcriptional regulator